MNKQLIELAKQSKAEFTPAYSESTSRDDTIVFTHKQFEKCAELILQANKQDSELSDNQLIEMAIKSEMCHNSFEGVRFTGAKFPSCLRVFTQLTTKNIEQDAKRYRHVKKCLDLIDSTIDAAMDKE